MEIQSFIIGSDHWVGERQNDLIFFQELVKLYKESRRLYHPFFT
jgi:hypothetical protein